MKHPQSIILLFLTLLVSSAFALDISSGATITEGFNVMTAPVSTLPTDWRIDKITTVRTVGTYAAAGTATERSAGNSMATTAANGIYNFGAGDAASATDRAPGWLSSSSATKSGNLYLRLVNAGSSSIGSFTISYDVEKYRNGTNAAGFTIQMFYSTDGSTWTNAGSDFQTVFPGADADNAGFTSAPGSTVSVSLKPLTQPLTATQNIYLAWNYSVTSGSTTSNSQALGIDNVIISAVPAGPSVPTLTTVAVTGITQSSAITGGNITSNGGSDISSKGVCWNTTGNPTIADGLTFDGTGISNYVSTIDGLAPSTLYYVKAYAANAMGVGYGNELSFTTSGTTPPTAPVALDATAITTDSFTANWNSVSDATSYRLDVSTSGTFDVFVSGYHDLTVTGLSQAVSGLTPATPFYYRVRAVNSNGTSENSNVIYVQTANIPVIPDAPVAIAATGLASTGFTANWNASNGATSYRLDVSMSDTFASFVTGYQDLTVNGLSQTVSGLAPLSVYFYRVRAFNAAGTSFNSNPIMVQTTEAASTILTEGFEGSTTAAPPVGWTLSSPGSYILSNVANAHGGTCYGGLNALNGWISTPQLDNPTEMTFWCRASGTTSNFTISIQNSANGTDYTDVTTFVANGTDTGSITSTYTQKSVSLNLTGSNYLRWFVSVRTGGSFYFDDVVVNGGSVTPVLPSIPVASDASSITATSFTANWIASTNASYYRLDVSTSSSFNSFVTGFNDLVVTGLSQAVTALDPETFYYYRVRAANTVGTSDNSNIVQVYTTSNPVIPNAPVATQATSISAITFTANWNAVTTATGYRLDVSASPTFGSYISGYQDLAVDGVSQVVTGLSALSTYYYRVRAVNNAGTSTNSNSISVTTTNTDPYNGYYNPVVGLTGNALKTGLTNLISTNTYSSYDGAKLIMFQQLDNHNGVVRCVYTGQDFSIAPDYNGSSSPNTEHTYAQSWFTGPASVEKADLHHLFVTESTVNSSRGNLPFGKVITTATTYASYNGYVSKRGTDFNSQTVFEPADQHKGDCARALLYFNVRYGESLTIGGVDQLPACIQWNYLDPPNADEIARNTLIQATLTNRNPFVDHPEYVTSIYVGTTSNTMLNFDPTVSSVSENVGTVHLSVQIQNPNVYASTATVVLKSGNPAHIGNFTPVTVTFPMNSATPQIVDINVTDDDIVDGNETFVFEIQNAQGGYYAIPGLANDYTLTVEDNETGIQVPIALPAVQMGNTAFLAHWVAPNGITSFALDVAHDNGFTNFLSGFNNLIVNDTTYSVTGLVEGQTYYYRVRSILNDVQSTNSNVITIILTGNQDHVVNSLRAGIESVYPNPFNPETTIKYNVTKPGDVSIVIYNVKGQKVRTLVADHLNSGSYTVKWDGNNDKGQSCSSSVYYLKMQEGNKISLKKIVLMK